jgi:hypothetical protein
VKRWIAFLSVTGLFVIGILIGALGMRLYDTHDSLIPGGFPGRAHPSFFIRQLGRRLDLTPEQRSRIAIILEEAHAEAEQFREEMAPRVHEHLERTHERIAEVLTERQREMLEAMLARHRGRTLEWFLGPPGPHGVGPGGPPPPH